MESRFHQCDEKQKDPVSQYDDRHKITGNLLKIITW